MSDTYVFVNGLQYKLVPAELCESVFACWSIDGVPHKLMSMDCQTSITEHEVKVDLDELNGGEEC
jgi:hypothetical protein